MTTVAEVKSAARGRWADILTQFGFDGEQLTGRHCPCPVCGGTDRFRALDDFAETGGVYCNQCFNERNGDGLAAIGWRNGWQFPQVMQAVADHLGISGTTKPASSGKPSPKPAADTKPGFPTMEAAIESYRLGEPSQVYSYPDRLGNIIGAAVRWDIDGGKTIRPACLNGTGWKPEGMPEPRPLYGLDRLPIKGRVYVTEGEKCADAIRNLGLHATTSPNGSNSAHKADWTPLAGLEVVILPDNDPSGDKYAAAVVEILAKLDPKPAVRVLRLDGLPDGGDIVDWLDARDAAEVDDLRQQLETLADAQAAESEPIKPGTIQIRTAGELCRDFPSLRPSLVEGLMRSGETMNIIAASKFGKSWLMLCLAFCVACGLKWLGRFWCRRGKVLYVDNELHPETLAHRIPKVADSLGLKPDDWAESLCIVNLRGQLLDLNRLSAQLLELEPGAFDLIILDAWYRLQPSGSDENANGDVMALYNLLDAVAAKIGSAFICVHHSSKGNQAGKSVTDVGSGAGAQSRAADCHLVLRAHEEESAVVVEAAVRSWAPMDPFCMRWEFPAWTAADDLDPKALKQERPKRKPSTEAGPDREEIQRDKHAEHIARVVQALESYPEGETENKLRDRAGMSGATFGPVLTELIKNRSVVPCKVKKGHAEYPGYRLSSMVPKSNSDNSDNSDKTRNSSDLSELSGGGRTTAPPLGGGVQSDLSLPDWDSADGPSGGRPA